MAVRGPGGWMPWASADVEEASPHCSWADSFPCGRMRAGDPWVWNKHVYRQKGEASGSPGKEWFTVLLGKLTQAIQQ